MSFVCCCFFRRSYLYVQFVHLQPRKHFWPLNERVLWLCVADFNIEYKNATSIWNADHKIECDCCNYWCYCDFCNGQQQQYLYGCTQPFRIDTFRFTYKLNTWAYLIGSLMSFWMCLFYFCFDNDDSVCANILLFGPKRPTNWQRQKTRHLETTTEWRANCFSLNSDSAWYKFLIFIFGFVWLGP